MPPPGHPAHPASYESYLLATGQWGSQGNTPVRYYSNPSPVLPKCSHPSCRNPPQNPCTFCCQLACTEHFAKHQICVLCEVTPEGSLKIAQEDLGLDSPVPVLSVHDLAQFVRGETRDWWRYRMPRTDLRDMEMLWGSADVPATGRFPGPRGTGWLIATTRACGGEQLDAPLNPLAINPPDVWDVGISRGATPWVEIEIAQALKDFSKREKRPTPLPIYDYKLSPETPVTVGGWWRKRTAFPDPVGYGWPLISPLWPHQCIVAVTTTGRVYFAHQYDAGYLGLESKGTAETASSLQFAVLGQTWKDSLTEVPIDREAHRLTLQSLGQKSGESRYQECHRIMNEAMGLGRLPAILRAMLEEI